MVGVGSQRSLHTGSLEMGHSWSSLENWEEEGKEPARVMFWHRPRRGESPVLLPGYGHGGHLTQELQMSFSQGSWGTSSVRVPPCPTDLQPWLPFQHKPLSPGTVTAAPQQDTPIADQPLWTHSGLWVWGQDEIPSQDRSTHHPGMWPSHAPSPPEACGQRGVRMGDQGQLAGDPQEMRT